ncbi:MAG TPA: apolipoprotein N-acyltransferase [Acidimicrobiales bacterium]|nr:apolipoprotein N-acyltransferase [Acidimicrobiales bacterium]
MDWRRLGGAVGAGLLLTAALPPFGWWPLAFAGAALAVHVLDEQVGRRRALLAYAVGVGFLVPGLWWMSEFTAPGYVLAVLFESLLFAIGPFVARPRWSLVAGVVVSEAIRASWPFGGVPVPTVAHTQVGGPLLQAARIGGELLLAAAVVVGGVAIVEAWRRRWVPAAAWAAAVLVVAGAGFAAPRGERTGALDVAAVQGGGERGTRAISSDEAEVFQRHLDASEDVEDGLDLVLWPENVVHVDDPVQETPEGDALSALAAELDATLVAGVVIGGEAEQDADVFINLAEAWGPDGEPLGRYEKNARVPFGEFIPFRSIVESLADVSAVPRDARVGHEPGFLHTPAGDLGIVISWEVFFADRARDAISTGGEVLLVPTNAASFSTAQMPALELGAARLRAVETGRDVVQAAPTGFSAFVEHDGDVVEHSDLGRRQVLHHTVDVREGKTLYTRLGDGPFVLWAGFALTRSVLRRRRAA